MIKILNYSAVLVGAGFTPNTINAEQLASKDIVPNEWDWTVGGSGANQLVSQVIYTNGYSIRVERNKFVVTGLVTENNVEGTKVSDIAQRFVENFPQLGYAGLGLNFDSIVIIPDYAGFVENNLLQKGNWTQAPFKLSDAAVVLRYPIEDGLVTINVEEGEAEISGEGGLEKYNGLLVRANFHREVDLQKKKEFISDKLANASKDAEFFQNISQRIIEA